MADHALQALTSSRIREVVILGRRGPAQASFTAPELLELLDQNHFEVVIENAEAHAAAPGASAGEALRMRLLNEIQARAWPATQRRLVLRFLATPLEIVGSERSEEHTSELQSLMRISYTVFRLNKKPNL